MKNLGVSLDKKLFWKIHVDVKMKRTLTGYEMCRRTYSPTWGLWHYAVIWIYVAISGVASLEAKEALLPLLN